MLGDARAFAVFLHHQPGCLPAEPTTTGVQEHCLGIVASPPLRRHQPGAAAGREPLLQGLGRRRSERHDALLRTLAVEAHELGVEVERTDRQSDRLGDPSAGRVEQLEQCQIAAVDGFGDDHRIEQTRHLRLGQRFRDARRDAHPFEIGRRVVRSLTLQRQIAVQHADGRELPGDRRRGRATRPPFADELHEHRRGHRLDRLATRLQPRDVRLEVASVGGQRVDRPALLRRHPRQELLGGDREFDGRHSGPQPSPAARRRSVSNRPTTVLASKISPLITRSMASRNGRCTNAMYCSSGPCRSWSTGRQSVAR